MYASSSADFDILNSTGTTLVTLPPLSVPRNGQTIRLDASFGLAVGVPPTAAAELYSFIIQFGFFRDGRPLYIADRTLGGVTSRAIRSVTGDSIHFFFADRPPAGTPVYELQVSNPTTVNVHFAEVSHAALGATLFPR